MARLVDVIWVERERKSFCRGDWTGGITLIPKEIFFFCRHSPGPSGGLRFANPPSLLERGVGALFFSPNFVVVFVAGWDFFPLHNFLVIWGQVLLVAGI